MCSMGVYLKHISILRPIERVSAVITFRMTKMLQQIIYFSVHLVEMLLTAVAFLMKVVTFFYAVFYLSTRG